MRSVGVGDANPVVFVAIAFREQLINESVRFIALEVPLGEMFDHRFPRLGIVASVDPLLKPVERLTFARTEWGFCMASHVT
jgi:hypothetical protein